MSKTDNMSRLLLACSIAVARTGNRRELLDEIAGENPPAMVVTPTWPEEVNYRAHRASRRQA